MTNEELGKRAVACDHWRWLPGMLALDSCNEEHPARVIDARRCVVYEDNDGAIHEGVVSRSDVPDLTDPATLGCLLALVRKVYRQHTLWLASDCVADPLDDTEFLLDEPLVFSVVGAEEGCYVTNLGRGRTEAEALVAALEAVEFTKTGDEAA